MGKIGESSPPHHQFLDPPLDQGDPGCFKCWWGPVWFISHRSGAYRVTISNFNQLLMDWSCSFRGLRVAYCFVHVHISTLLRSATVLLRYTRLHASVVNRTLIAEAVVSFCISPPLQCHSLRNNPGVHIHVAARRAGWPPPRKMHACHKTPYVTLLGRFDRPIPNL